MHLCKAIMNTNPKIIQAISGPGRGRKLLALTLALILGIATASAFSVAGITQASAVLTISPASWGTIGLDSNDVTAGPNTFQVGARVCNTGNSPANNLVANYNWLSANSLINIASGSTSSLSLTSLPAGQCNLFYFPVEITRSAAAYNTTRAYQITSAPTAWVKSRHQPIENCTLRGWYPSSAIPWERSLAPARCT